MYWMIGVRFLVGTGNILVATVSRSAMVCNQPPSYSLCTSIKCPECEADTFTVMNLLVP
jgi:hypothetical protein